MSTEIGQIEGRFEEVESVEKRTVRYRPCTLYLTQFSGGEKNGVMLQMTIAQENGESAFIQLTRDQVRDLVATLKEEFKIGSWKL